LYILTIEETFASAHQLRGYQGKCENLHGHSWKVELSVKGEKLNDIGLLIDFQELKVILREITAYLDHKNINELPPFDRENPSSENMARYIYEEVEKRLARKAPEIKLHSITVWNRPLLAATYMPEAGR
jgi:6-pyruvoyltetrahydropterin/6-carboxytetrahydropterin synthase